MQYWYSGDLSGLQTQGESFALRVYCRLQSCMQPACSFPSSLLASLSDRRIDRQMNRKTYRSANTQACSPIFP